MRALVYVLVFGLAACSAADVRDTKIADIDFTDQAAIQRIEQRLTPTERASFNGYVMSRLVMPAMEVVKKDGTAPETVREAIELTRQRGEWMTERNKLVEQRNALTDGGVDDKERPEWERLGKQVEDLDRRIAETKVK